MTKAGGREEVEEEVGSDLGKWNRGRMRKKRERKEEVKIVTFPSCH